MVGTTFLHGKKTSTTATLILVGATQVGLSSCLLILTVETTALILHFHMISLHLQTVQSCSYWCCHPQKTVKETATDRPFLARIDK